MLEILLKDIRLINIGKIVIGLNINSVRQKLDKLSEITTANIEKLIIPETKLDESFQKVQFLIKCLSEPCRLNQNSKRGGIKLFIRDDTPSNLLSIKKNHVETLHVEIN